MSVDFSPDQNSGSKLGSSFNQGLNSLSILSLEDDVYLYSIELLAW